MGKDDDFFRRIAEQAGEQFLKRLGFGPGAINLLPLWKGCQAGMTLLGIQSDGGVKGCLSLPPQFIEGYVKNASLHEIWNSPTAFSYNRRFSPEDLTNECVTCSYGKTCKGGCLSISPAVTGNPHGDPYCLRTIEKNMLKDEITVFKRKNE